MTSRKIIVGYDRSADAKAATAWALDEGARTGAPVEFCYVWEWPAWIPAASMVPAPAVWPDRNADHAIKEMLDEVVAAAKQTHPAVLTTTFTLDADIALTLIDRSGEASLVVLGSRGHSAVAGLLGSVSAAVSAHAHCPVVVVRGDQAASTPVVAGIDDSPQAQSVLAFAAEQAAARHVPLRLVHAWKPVTGIWADTAMATATITPAERQPFDDLVAAIQQRYPEVEISADAVMDHPAAALVSASTSAQLLVVGSRGRGAARGMLLGSVSQHLLRHSRCTVTVVHDPKP